MQKQIYKKIIDTATPVIRDINYVITSWVSFLAPIIYRSILKYSKIIYVFITRILRPITTPVIAFLNRYHQMALAKSSIYGRITSFRLNKLGKQAVGAFFAIAVIGLFMNLQKAGAAGDLALNWDFSNPASFSFDDGIETSGSSSRLKAQNYTPDGSTKALFHFDETSGSSATDDSTGANNATISNGSFVTGNLNNGLSLNGNSTVARANDTAGLSLNQNNTLEGWSKFNTSLSAGNKDKQQGIIDKGSYKLYYDNETGKVTYELANSSSTNWTQQAGNDIKNSWDLNGKFSVNDQVSIGTNVYAALGNAVGDAEVWKWDGSNWSQIGGDGKNSSWADQTFENALTLSNDGTTLYAGLGSSAGDAEVWSCDTSSNCASWTKIGGDAINSSWAVNTFEEVTSMTVMGGNLYAGLGNSANDARVYRWNGASWAWVGGFGIGGPYNAFPTGYEAVYSLTNDGTNIYAGFGASAGDADVWRLTGTTWTQIGGDGTGWTAATYESVLSMDYFGGNLYVGLGLTAGDAEVYRYNGATWTKIGGDTLNSSWDSTNYEGVYALANDGTSLYAGLGATAGDNEVYRWNGASWSKIGGDTVNSSFTNTHTVVRSLLYANSTLYAGLISTGDNAESWSYNGTSWTRMGGGYINNSWGGFNIQNVESMTTSGGYLYAGTGNTVAGNAQVWRFDGTTWQIVGGQGLNGSWTAKTIENVLSMDSFNGDLYVGLGTTAGDGDVWRYNGSTWTQIGGDTLNSSWPSATYEEVYSLASYGGNLYAGLGNTASDAEVWRYNGSTWAKIGGDGTGWAAGFERVSSMTVLDNQLYVGLGASTTDAEVWRWNGSAWSKIGGDGTASSWNTIYEQVESLTTFNGKVYAGLGNTTGDSEVWEYNGTAWSKIGGDGIDDSWLDGQYEQVKSLQSYNGKLYAGLANGAGDGEVWEFENNSWSKVGGSAVNGSWTTNATETVRSMATYKGKLYAGLGDSANVDAAIWSYGNNGFLQSSAVTQDTNWHHIAATYNGSTMKIFIDGAQDAQTNVSLSIPDSTQPLLIGSTYSSTKAGESQGYFEGILDEVRISDTARTSFTTQPYASSAQTITLNDPVWDNGVWYFDSLDDDTTLNGGTVTYRLSDNNGSTWKYWNGSAWVVSNSTAQANSTTDITANFDEFPATANGLKWQAVLAGDGTQQVILNSIDATATSDAIPPATNADNIVAKKSISGDALPSNDWTNGANPSFTWDAGTDAESGIKGYCLYLGSDDTADPVTTKGILGTSPGDSAGNCQFMTTSADLDTAVGGILASPLVTSNSPYYIRIKAIDNAGNLSTSTEQFQFRFDNTPPSNPSFISAPSGFISSKQATLSWITSGAGAPADINSGLSGLQYKINSSVWYGDTHSGSQDQTDLLTNDGAYITQTIPDFADLNEGVNTVYFRTWDQAGNVTTNYVSAALKINTAGAPSEPLNVNASPSTNTANSFSFSWAAPNTFVGDENNLTYCYTFNVTPSAGNCTFTSPGTTSLGAGPYATQPGVNTIYVVAKDESGSINYASYESATFTANTSAPGIPLSVDIVDVSIKATSNWRLALTWDAPTDTGAGISSYKIYRSSNNISFNLVGSSSSTTYIDAGLAQTRYYYYVKACDSTNNCGANSSGVDDLPTGKFTSPAALVSPPVVTDITTKKAEVSWSTDRASDSKISLGTKSGEYASSEIANSNQVSAHKLSLDNLSAGTTYYYKVKWTDADGNTGTSAENSFKTAPPPRMSEVTVSDISLNAATIRFTSTDATKVAVYYGQSEALGGVQIVNTSTAKSSYSVRLNNLTDGSKYFYKLVAYDNDGNTYDGNSATFTTPAQPKISNLRFQPIAGESTSTQQVTWDTNIPSDSMVTYGVVGTEGTNVQVADSVTSHSIIIRDLLDNSEYFLIAKSRDANGNLATSDRQVFRTALDTRPPKIRNVTVQPAVRGTGAEARGQVVVSWTTDEPATSQVAYSEGSTSSDFTQTSAEDNTLTFEHVVIVSNLPTSKVYNLAPVSKDKASNKTQGEAQSAVIGRASDDVMTVVLNALRKVFGF